MKNILLIFASFLFVLGLHAQQTENPYPANAEEDITLTWLTRDLRTRSYGGLGTVAAFMELTANDLLNFNNTGRKPLSVKQVQFYIEQKTRINECAVVLMRGTDVTTATRVLTQKVDTSAIVVGWNTINLDVPYTISDSTQGLYIGYEVKTSISNTPLGAASGDNPKQGWLLQFTGVYTNIAKSGYVFMIKALASSDDAAENEISLFPLEFPFYMTMGDTLSVKASLKNYGTVPLNSFSFSYDINGKQSNVQTYAGLNILPDSSYKFTHPQVYILDTLNSMHIKSSIFKPNNVADAGFNNSQTNVVLALPQTPTQRVVLHEVFTSSTCGPCKDGNGRLDSVLHEYDSAKWSCIKYQMNFPSSGDPYYTDECKARSLFYGDIKGVPTLVPDGLFELNIQPLFYTYSQLDAFAKSPAYVKMTGITDVNDKTVDFRATINPITGIDNPDLRFFAAIVEKRTVKNVKGNGEIEFFYVMKKFMTDVNGDPITSLVLNTPRTLTYSYTFNGDYRLPASAEDPIDNNTENSVEDFDNLMVVYWLQDIKNRVVYQSGKADPKNSVDIYTPSVEEANLSVFPNPAKTQFTILSSIPFSKVSIVNISGQTVREIRTNNATEYQIRTNNLDKGIYILRIETKEGVFVQKVQIQ